MSTISPSTHLIVKGARQHNLKNVDLVVPKNQCIVFTGLSGSGKSSLAFDTIYAEGQRRYVESLSSYARQFLGIMQKPDVDQIEGLSPAISIDQKTTSHNPRSTVGTITEIYDYLRLLFARIGHPHCPNCGSQISPQTIDQIVATAQQQIQTQTISAPTRWYIQSPIVKDKRGEFTTLFDSLKKKGFSRIRVDGHVYGLDEDILLIKTNRHTIDVIVDRFTVTPKQIKNQAQVHQFRKKLFAAIQTALDVSQGRALLSQITDPSLEFPPKPTQFQDLLFSQQFACPQCNLSFSAPEPRLFSFNTPHGACPTCTGLGSLQKIDPEKIIAPDLTLSEGAIIPLANALSTDSWYARKIKAVVQSNHESYTIPYKQLSGPIKQILLYGQKKYYRVEGSNREGRQASFSFMPEGIVHELERRYQETQSDFMRQEIGRFMRKEVCPDCHGNRLKPEALAVTVNDLNIADVTRLSISRLSQFTTALYQESQNISSQVLSRTDREISLPVLKEIVQRVEFLVSVGLDYLSLHREAATLAGGEAQRIRLASQIGTGLTGVLYVLDEPTIGLHARDNDRLINTLKRLRDLGNTVIIVEHDENVIKAADVIVDFGPKAGNLGGEIIAQGNLAEIIQSSASLTGQYLAGKKKITALTLAQAAKQLPLGLITPPKIQSTSLNGQSLVLKGASHHNLKTINVTIPLNQMVVITGVSGSGKSTLMHDTLYPALRKHLGLNVDTIGHYQSLSGTDNITKALLIDQSPIGRTPRSNPATYTKVFDVIRDIFSQTKDARALGFKPGRFSFNVKGGRCEACQGGGEVKIEMQFLSDVYVTCEACQGARYNSETLSVLYQGNSIADVLNLTVDQALKLFKNHNKVTKKLATLQSVGLGYIKLGQSAPTLSGGEAQRVKLAKELSTAASGHTVYLLDEPTTGLHFEDVLHLLIVLRSLVDQNNTVVIIEHNLDVIKNADWVIDLGPGGGDAGGHVIATGTPEAIASQKTSVTGRYL